MSERLPPTMTLDIGKQAGLVALYTNTKITLDRFKLQGNIGCLLFEEYFISYSIIIAIKEKMFT